MAASQDNMTCTVCTEVYRSPRFLPCYHSFCLPCLEELAKRHRNIIPCPTCRAPATVPPGGVCDLQVNFYFTEEALEQARRAESHTTCRVHTDERVVFRCTQCDQVICIRCKLTKHEGHSTEDLSEAAARSKKTITMELQRLINQRDSINNDQERLKCSEERVRKYKARVAAEIQARHDKLVTMVRDGRDQALRELNTISDDLQKQLAADTQRVQDELNSLLQLQSRAQRALSSACDTEVLEVEREMTRGGRNENTMPLLDRKDYIPALRETQENNIQDNIKKFIGSPFKKRWCYVM